MEWRRFVSSPVRESCNLLYASRYARFSLLARLKRQIAHHSHHHHLVACHPPTAQTNLAVFTHHIPLPRHTVTLAPALSRPTSEHRYLEHHSTISVNPLPLSIRYNPPKATQARKNPGTDHRVAVRHFDLGVYRSYIPQPQGVGHWTLFEVNLLDNSNETSHLQLVIDIAPGQ